MKKKKKETGRKRVYKQEQCNMCVCVCVCVCVCIAYGNSGIIAWEISWTEEPGRLQSMGLQRVTHNLVTK